MRDPYKMFRKLMEKDPKIAKLAEKAKQMPNEEIQNLPVPIWQKNILSEIRMKKLLKKSVDDIPIKEVKHWDGVDLEIREIAQETWLKQDGKENLIELGDTIAILNSDRLFWGYTFLTGCYNIPDLIHNSEFVSMMEKDAYLDYYKSKLRDKHNHSETDIIDAEYTETTGNTGRGLLDRYGVRFNR